MYRPFLKHERSDISTLLHNRTPKRVWLFDNSTLPVIVSNALTTADNLGECQAGATR